MLLTTLTFIAFSLQKFAIAQDVNVAQVKKAFDDAHIPSDIKINFNPKALLEVTFPQKNNPPITLHAGIHLPIKATAGPPTYSVIGTASKGPFVIIAVDPDAPSPQNTSWSPIRHFLGGNFFPTQLGSGITTPFLTNSTPAVTEFVQPAPPPGSDPHRYIFLLYEQPSGFNEQTLVTPTTSILVFNLTAFVAAVGLGDPIAGTFMLVADETAA